ncbi:RDD family protein [Pedobacter changchengzhani]|uniref:RDD family protein n=1 Tax=Pedobacter changchengzhani TaxID=2529274 RepID=A0A4R5MNF8_9SPHI|nr:RDD family protein [Pedobacter changchengzhani]TDG37188.1 RDD family protein [Pedobacter changchengzhani]
MDSIKINTAQNVEVEYEIASLGDRIAARLIDLALFAVLAIIMMVIFIVAAISRSEAILITIVAVFLAIFTFYDLVCELTMDGKSIGKKLMKIRVISLDGNRPTLSQYLLRWLFRIIDFTLTSQLLALISVAISEKKQRIGDIVANTTLIKTVPRTQFHNIAFVPVEAVDYQVTFKEVLHLNDRDVELIHEVIKGFNESGNADLIYTMAAKIKDLLSISIPQGMNELQFLELIKNDYNFLTANESV